MENPEIAAGDSGLIGCFYGYSVTAASFGLFMLLNRLVKRYAIPDWIDEAERWRWKNVLISLIHAVIIGVWTLSCFALYPEITDDLIGIKNLYIYTAVSFSTGYFVSDSLDFIINGHVRDRWPMVVHHVVVLWIFLYNLTHCTCLGYTIVALTVEINSVFLHLRKLMQIAKVRRENLAYRANAVATLLTIVTCRFSALGWISHGIATSYHRFSVFYRYPLSVSVAVMWVLYIVSFHHILTAEFLSKEKKSEIKADNVSGASPVTNGTRNLKGKSE